MTWCSFRPSDDQTVYGYLVPANMFVVKVLEHVQEIMRVIYQDQFLETLATKLKNEVDEGIHKYGTLEINSEKVYAYEVDGLGNQLFIDDANIPSLLSIDYIGYKSDKDPNGEITKNTRKYILSEHNPNYFEGSVAKVISYLII